MNGNRYVRDEKSEGVIREVIEVQIKIEMRSRQG